MESLSLSQSKRQSLIETLSNTFIGMVGSFGIAMLTLSFFTTPWVVAAVTTIACTVWSVGRGYYVRRYFNKQLLKEKANAEG